MDHADTGFRSADTASHRPSPTGKGAALRLRTGWRWSHVPSLLRVHQWTKNLLVFIPMIASHELSLEALAASGLAFLAFSFVASSAYVLNDIIDVKADRVHPRKRLRLFASGAVPRVAGLLLIPALLLVGGTFAAALPMAFWAVIGFYWVLTCAYSLRLRRMLLVDVVALGCLYGLRVVGGAVAIGIHPSEWLAAFSVFFFLSLALVKRYTELAMLAELGGEDRAANRSYRVSDLSVLVALAAASGFNAVTIFTRYISSDEIVELYGRPVLLWLIIPVLVYWLSRLILLAHRLKVHDDPVVFAIRDLKSWLCGAAVGAILLCAS